MSSAIIEEKGCVENAREDEEFKQGRESHQFPELSYLPLKGKSFRPEFQTLSTFQTTSMFMWKMPNKASPMKDPQRSFLWMSKVAIFFPPLTFFSPTEWSENQWNQVDRSCEQWVTNLPSIRARSAHFFFLYFSLTRSSMRWVAKQGRKCLGESNDISGDRHWLSTTSKTSRKMQSNFFLGK